MSDQLAKARQELRLQLKEYAKPLDKDLSEDQSMRNEAAYAATNLKEENASLRIKAIEFLEILGGNPYAEEYVVKALRDPESIVVQKAVSALSKIGTPASLGAIREFLKECKSRQLSSELNRLITKLEKDQID